MNKLTEDRIRQIENKLGRPIIDLLMEEEELCTKFPWGAEHTSPFMVLPTEDIEFLYLHADIFEKMRAERGKAKAS